MSNKTIEDIAAIVGCSVGTVSRAINNRKGVGVKTRERIFKVMDEVGYQPNAVAQSLSNKRTNTIAVLIPDFSHAFLGGAAQAIEKELSIKGYNTLLFNTGWNPEIERKKLLAAQARRVDGIIFKPSLNTVDFMKDIDTPMVLVSHTYDGNISCVDIENEGAGFMATEYLIKCGYRKIAFIGGSTNKSMIELRYNGYKRALEKYGLPLRKDFVLETNDAIKDGYKHAEVLLSREERPDAMFCIGDLAALGACKSAYEHGIDVPNQLGIMGFNNDEFAELPQIALTTVSQPRDRIGTQAAHMIIDMIEQKENWYPQKVLYSPEIIVRSTTRDPVK